MIANTQQKVISLTDWLRGPYQLHREIRENTAHTYQAAIWAIQNAAGTELTNANICDDLLNLGLVEMVRAGRSTHYVRSVKTSVATIWRDMADAGLCEYPRRVRRIRTARLRHTVWTSRQVGALIATARGLQGPFRTVRLDRAMYWETLIRTAWDTGMRQVDLHRLRRCDIDEEWTDEQHKTRKPVRCLLRCSTLEAIDQWGRDVHHILWPIWGSYNAFRGAWDRLVRLSGLDHAPFKTLRKSAGTAAEAACPGAGHLLLGNTRAVFERHYLDASHVTPPQPPELT